MAAVVRAGVAPEDRESIPQRDAALSGRRLCKGVLTFAKTTVDQAKKSDDQGRFVVSIVLETVSLVVLFHGKGPRE